MKYNLTITDNETGETLKSLDCNAIIGGLNTGNMEGCTVVLSDCGPLDLFAAFKSAEKALAHLMEQDKHIKMMNMMDQMFDVAEEKKVDESEDSDDE